MNTSCLEEGGREGEERKDSTNICYYMPVAVLGAKERRKTEFLPLWGIHSREKMLAIKIHIIGKLIAFGRVINDLKKNIKQSKVNGIGSAEESGLQFYIRWSGKVSLRRYH